MNKEKYYNLLEYTKIKQLIFINPYLAKEKMESYMDSYPNDYFAKNLYANILIILKETDNVLNVLKECYEQSKIDSLFMCKNNDLYDHMIFTYIRYLSYIKDYESIYNFAIKNNFDYSEYKSIFLYAELLTGKKEVGNRPSYKISQLLSYDKNLFLEHIKKHLSTDKHYDITSDAVFNEDFPLTKVLDEIYLNLNNTKSFFYSFITDLYFFKYDNCGFINGKSTDYFKVVTIHDTSNIITMYPCSEGKYFEYTDINNLNKENTYTRKLSQIDKFNLRYNKK